jgi:hypothetical protein
MSAIEAEPRHSVLDAWGGPAVELASRFPISVRPVVGELICQLRLKCGSYGQGTVPRGYQPTSPVGWRTLREVSPAELIDACRRVERAFPQFHLNGSDAQSVHTRIEFLLRSEED